MLHDRSLQRRSLRQALERSGRRSAKHKLDDLVVGRPAFSRDKRESALEAHNVRISRQVLGKLLVEQPGVALGDTVPLTWKVPLVKRPGLRERCITGPRCQTAPSGDMHAEGRVSPAKASIQAG